MPINLSIKNVPESIAAKLRQRAERNHRSLQGELMAIVERAATEREVHRVDAGSARYNTDAADALSGGLLDRLKAIAGDRGIDTGKRLSREQAHDRKTLRKAGV